MDNVSSDVQDISALQLRLEGTKAGAAAAGSAGLLSFDQRMHHPDAGAVPIDDALTLDHTDDGVDEDVWRRARVWAPAAGFSAEYGG